MDTILDFLDHFILGPMDLINRFEGLIRGVQYRDMGVKFAAPRPDKNNSHTIHEIENILGTYGIPIFGRTFDAEHIYFRVKRRQASWAEYLLLHAGVELQNQPIDRRNYGYVGSHEPGWMPTPWSHTNE